MAAVLPGQTGRHTGTLDFAVEGMTCGSFAVAANPLAALGLLDPILAGAAMGLSSVSVVANSLRLRRFHRR